MAKRAKLDDEVFEEVFDDSIEENEGSEDDNESHHSSVPSDMGELEVNFQAKSIVTDDSVGVKRLLHQLFPKSPLNLSKLANYICSQDSIGSVLKLAFDSVSENTEEEEKDINKSSDDTSTTSTEPSSSNHGNNEEDEEEAEEVLGVSTLLYLSERQDKDSPVTTEVKDYILAQLKDHCTDSDTVKVFQDVLGRDAKGSGIIIHERFLNIPTDIGPPMLESLLEEVDDYYKGNSPTHYVFITRSHMEEAQLKAGKKRKNEEKHKKPVSAELVIEFEEVDCLYLEKMCSFTFPVSPDCDTVQGGGWDYDDTPFNPRRTVFIMEKEKLVNGISKLLNMYQASAC